MFRSLIATFLSSALLSGGILAGCQQRLPEDAIAAPRSPMPAISTVVERRAPLGLQD